MIITREQILQHMKFGKLLETMNHFKNLLIGDESTDYEPINGFIESLDGTEGRKNIWLYTLNKKVTTDMLMAMFRAMPFECQLFLYLYSTTGSSLGVDMFSTTKLEIIKIDSTHDATPYLKENGIEKTYDYFLVDTNNIHTACSNKKLYWGYFLECRAQYFEGISDQKKAAWDSMFLKYAVKENNYLPIEDNQKNIISQTELPNQSTFYELEFAYSNVVEDWTEYDNQMDIVLGSAGTLL